MTDPCVFMLEEASMEHFLRGLLPRLAPTALEGVDWWLIPHQGKSDLEKSVPRKLRAWRHPKARFVIVRDQDSADCKPLKTKLLKLATAAGDRECFVRIACRELEAWYFGDLQTVGQEYGQPQIVDLGRRAAYRIPDEIVTPSRALEEHLSGFGKMDAARRLGSKLAIEENRSGSFLQFVKLVERVFPHA